MIKKKTCQIHLKTPKTWFLRFSTFWNFSAVSLNFWSLRIATEKKFRGGWTFHFLSRSGGAETFWIHWNCFNISNFRTFSKKTLISYRKSRQILEKMAFWGLGGLGGHFHCKYCKKNSRKAPYNYSASFGTSNFSISLSEDPKSHILKILKMGSISIKKLEMKIW